MVTTLTKKPPAYRRAPEQKREALLAAARDLFSTQGFEDTSTIQIADRAGVSEGILFHHFGSKKGLLLRIAEDFAREAAAATMPEDAEETSEEAVVRNAFDFAEQNPALYQMFLKGGSQFAEIDIASKSDLIVDEIRKNLERGMAQGLIRRGDPRIMAELQFTVVDGAYKAWRRTGDPDRREDYITEAVRCMKAMLSNSST